MSEVPVPSVAPPKESRRWLKRRVPKEQLYRLAPPRPEPKRLGRQLPSDYARNAIRAWWIWLALSIAGAATGWWIPAALAGALAFVFYHMSPRSHPAVYAIEPGFDTGSEEFRNTMVGMTGTPLVAGNRADLFNNGDEFYPAMLEAIESAQHSVTMEQYIFWDGETGRRFAEAFAESARRGVHVKLLVDAIGSSTLGGEILDILKAGGCQLAWFGPIHWYTLNRANWRTHRKSLIVDGRVAFTGGAGIADHWLGSARNYYEWRDIQIRVEGPAALALQTAFARNWLVTTGEILNGHGFFPAIGRQGEVEVQTISSSPTSGAAAAATMYLIAVQCACRELLIANPYFIPDARVIEMVAATCRRGVKVKIMLASAHNDTWWARQNSVRLYGQLLDAGVEIYEFQPTMLHQKTMVVDDAWATVGTTNFDNRSFALSEETNLCFHDRDLIRQLREIFHADLAQCRQINLKEWKRRGLRQRASEQFASLIRDQV